MIEMTDPKDKIDFKSHLEFSGKKKGNQMREIREYYQSNSPCRASKDKIKLMNLEESRLLLKK